ncbi:MAG: hypothetical protein DME21_16520 [Verrucomicrobia bacterium]|nr:MAG: hypothetical protein DME21_16520 [Verrucomicrobiota bacterium]
MKFPSANGYVFMRDVILSRRDRPRSRFSRFVRRMFQANCLLEKDEMEMRKDIFRKPRATCEASASG